tara:strand:+ start:17206 stop:17898 length:693 start_codon:yes stop_codon:yes gene_type:complete
MKGVVCAVGLCGIAVFSGCSGPQTRQTEVTPARLSAIADELIELAADDQRYEQMVMNNEIPGDRDEFMATKKRLMSVRGQRCKAIFEEIGFPDYEMVGQEASDGFWVIVQHNDTDPVFQERVAKAMRGPVERGAADGSKLAYLTDRVLINTDRPQMYGTQLTYIHEQARAIPKELGDPAGVDARRAAVGLEPLSVYMNGSSELFFMMNEAPLREMGVTEPFVYEAGFSAW